MADEAVNMRNFGGVNLNWNEVESAKINKGNDGKETYFIKFKSGVKAEYPLQEGASMSSRELTMWQSLDYDNETVIEGMRGAKIEGAQDDDHIVASNIRDCVIDVANDANDDHVEIKNDRFEAYDGTGAEYNNRLHLDKHDTAVEHYKKQTLINGKYENVELKNGIKGPGTENRF